MPQSAKIHSSISLAVVRPTQILPQPPNYTAAIAHLATSDQLAMEVANHGIGLLQLEGIGLLQLEGIRGGR
jgi:hypothetical protein